MYEVGGGIISIEDFKKDYGETLDTMDKKRVKFIQRKLNVDVRDMVRKNFLDIIDGTF